MTHLPHLPLQSGPKQDDKKAYASCTAPVTPTSQRGLVTWSSVVSRVSAPMPARLLPAGVWPGGRDWGCLTVQVCRSISPL